MDRVEAVARIKDHIEIHRYHERNAVKIFEALNMAIKVLEQPVQQWIPVTKRLPEDETVVLVCTEDEFMYLAERTCGHWEEITGFCSVDDTVAWMPLPEPYREGEQDE